MSNIQIAMKEIVVIVLFLFALFINQSDQVHKAQKNGASSNDDGAKWHLIQQKNPFTKQMKKMYNSGIFADVKFSFGEGNGQTLLSAHTNILALYSVVFKELFDAQKANKKQSKGKAQISDSNNSSVVDQPGVVVIQMDDDVDDVDAFKTMLRFIYTYDTSGIYANNLVAVREIANKFAINDLVEACDKLVNVVKSNVFFNYARAQFLEEKNVVQQLLNNIDQNASNLIQSHEFLQIEQNLLIEILERDQLVVKDELSIWEAALRWADEQCDQKGIECTAENRRQMLGPALYKIRFPLIPQHDFAGIVDSGVLPSEDVISIYQFHECQQNYCAVPVIDPSGQEQQRYPLQFCTQQRHYLQSRGRITFIINLSNRLVPTFSDAVQIGQLAWKIKAINDDEGHLSLYIYVATTVEQGKDTKWSCQCTSKVTIVSQNKEKEHFTRASFKFNFSAQKAAYGYSEFISFERLMDQKNGWYKNRSVTVVADLIVDELKKTVG